MRILNFEMHGRRILYWQFTTFVLEYIEPLYLDSLHVSHLLWSQLLWGGGGGGGGGFGISAKYYYIEAITASPFLLYKSKFTL